MVTDPDTRKQQSLYFCKWWKLTFHSAVPQTTTGYLIHSTPEQRLLCAQILFHMVYPGKFLHWLCKTAHETSPTSQTIWGLPTPRLSRDKCFVFPYPRAMKNRCKDWLVDWSSSGWLLVLAKSSNTTDFQPWFMEEVGHEDLLMKFSGPPENWCTKMWNSPRGEHLRN